MTKTIKVPQSLTRAATLERGEDGKPSRVSISSDVPYKRYDWWNDEEYYEVLDHGPGGCDDERLKAGLPILFNHDRDRHIARANGYTNDGHKLTLDIGGFIWASGPFAEEKRKDMESGALPDTSVGYELVGDGICVGAKDEIPVYKFKWKLYEASAVTIPADASVGVGRQRDNKPSSEPREIAIASQLQKGIDLSPEIEHTPNNQIDMIQRSRTLRLESDNGGGTGSAGSATATQPAPDLAKERAAALSEYKARCKKIDDFVKALRNAAWKERAGKIADKHKEGDANFDDFRAEALTSFDTDVQLDTPEREGHRSSGVVVIGERGAQPRLSLGTQFVRSRDYQERGGMVGQRRSVGLDVPDLTMLGIRGKVQMAQRAGFSSSDLSSVNLQVLPGMVTLGVQRLTIMDLLAPGTTTAAALPYARENSFGTVNGTAVAANTFPRAQTVGEGGLKPTWDPDLTTETANVKKVAVITKVPDEFMADFPTAQSYIDERLPYMVDLETEFQLLYGDGIGNNIKGITAAPGIQTRAITTTSDATVAASLKQGLTDIQVNSQFEPTGYAFHPYDWETASLLKDTNGRFLAGGPYYIPYTNGVFLEMNTFWGKPVVVSTSVTYGKPIAGSWKLGAQYFIREGMRLEMTNANEDDFRRNLVAIRAEHRLALAVYRPIAFIEFNSFPARA